MKWPLVSLASIPPITPYLSDHRSYPEDYDSQLALAVIVFEREQYYTALYNPHSQYGEEPPGEHLRAWEPFPVTRFALAMLRELRHWNTSEPLQERPYDLFGLKDESLAGLTAALRPAKTHRIGYLMASQFCGDLCRHEEAQPMAEVAARLASNRRKPSSALAAQDAIFEEFRERAWLVRTKKEGERFTRFVKTERQFNEEEQEQAMAEFDPQRIPESLRHLNSIARRYGVGDDPGRAYFINKLSKQQRKRMVH